MGVLGMAQIIAGGSMYVLTCIFCMYMRYDVSELIKCALSMRDGLWGLGVLGKGCSA